MYTMNTKLKKATLISTLFAFILIGLTCCSSDDVVDTVDDLVNDDISDDSTDDPSDDLTVLNVDDFRSFVTIYGKCIVSSVYLFMAQRQSTT